LQAAVEWRWGLESPTTPWYSSARLYRQSRGFAAAALDRDLFAAAGGHRGEAEDAYTPAAVWYKMKNRAYTQMEGRWELFQKRG
jgi:hypothetical protein